MLRRTVSNMAMLVFVSLALPATITAGVIAQEHTDEGPKLGSVDDYMREQHAHSVREMPALGIEVCDGMGELATGSSMPGATVVRVIPDGPAARAGILGKRNLGKSVLTGAFVAGGLIFPPALFAALLIGQSDFGESHDTIIAVDSERTRDAEELDNAIGKSGGGRIVYLSVIRDGHRNQIRIPLRSPTDQTE